MGRSQLRKSRHSGAWGLLRPTSNVVLVNIKRKTEVVKDKAGEGNRGGPGQACG